jgi:hypothetical protein
MTEASDQPLWRSNLHTLHVLDLLALILVVIGGLNWLCIGLFQWNVLDNVLGAVSIVLERIMYVIIGMAAIYAGIRAPAMAHFRGEPSEHPA